MCPSSAHPASNNPDLCIELLKIVGDFLILAIIRTLKQGEMRFSELGRSLEGANPVTLTSRLKKLEETGFINRIEESRDKLSVTYSLTEKGRGMLPILARIESFASEFPPQ